MNNNIFVYIWIISNSCIILIIVQFEFSCIIDDLFLCSFLSSGKDLLYWCNFCYEDLKHSLCKFKIMLAPEIVVP
jgi:hypothetical protein